MNRAERPHLIDRFRLSAARQDWAMKARALAMLGYAEASKDRWPDDRERIHKYATEALRVWRVALYYDRQRKRNFTNV